MRQLDVDVARLRLMKADHRSQQYRLEDRLLKFFPQEIERNQGYIRGLEQDQATVAAHPLPEKDFVGMTIGGETFNEAKDAGEAMYKYDIDKLWLGDMPRVEDSLKGDGETRISLYPGEYLSIRYNGAEVERVGNVSDRGSNYTVPSGTTIPKGNYTIGEKIPAGTYKIFFSGTTTSRVRVFQDAKEASNTFKAIPHNSLAA